MKMTVYIAVALWAAMLLAEPPVLPEEPSEMLLEPAEPVRQVTAAVIPCQGMIDNGLYESIQRRTEIALDEGAEYLIYEIGTYGGLLQSADDISKYLILEVGKEAHTVAYVTTEAISAGALVSVSCKDIIMGENTTIGDCAPIAMGTKLEGVEREKAESFIRAAFMRAAEANNYPEPLLKAMVSLRIEVWRVKNLKSDEYEFYEADRLPKDPNAYDLENKELIDKDDELLTLTASQALKYGIARAKVKDRQGVLDFLAERDGVSFTEEPSVLETNWSEEMVRWVNSPAVISILFMVALLGVYIEFNTPGVGLPGLVAVICFAIIFGSKYLVGMANWVEIAIFATGVLLLFVEIFLIPGFGIAGTAGIICILVGLFGILISNRPDELPWPRTDFDWELFMNGALALVFGFTGFVLAAWLLAKYLPRLQLFGGLLLAPAVAKQGDEIEISMTAPPGSSELSVKIGDIGAVLSPLRPSGTARFGNAVVDVVARGEFLGRGNKVEIVEIHGNRVVVKAVED